MKASNKRVEKIETDKKIKTDKNTKTKPETDNASYLSQEGGAGVAKSENKTNLATISEKKEKEGMGQNKKTDSKETGKKQDSKETGKKRSLKEVGKPDIKKRPLIEKDWFKLDNAALIYPSAANGKWRSMYRISVYLYEDVNPEILQQALENIMPRFPSFDVCLRSGLFWYYFQKVSVNPQVVLEKGYPCKSIDFKFNKHLFRILYFKNKVSFECFHSLTDGFGALAFLNTLLSSYFILCGKKVNLKELPINYLDRPSEEEFRDGFLYYGRGKKKNSRIEKTAYQIHGTKEDGGKLNIITGELNADEVKNFLKDKNATITEFLIAVYFKALLKYQSEIIIQNKPIKVSMPINLRKMFPTNTLRNFSSYYNLKFEKEAESLSLDELIQAIKKQLAVVDKEYLTRNINTNTLAQKNIFVRLLPLFLKNIALKFSYAMFGENLYTTVFSNLGKIQTPKEFEEYIDRYEIMTGAGKVNKITLCGVTFKNKLCLTFSSRIKETTLQKLFFRELSDLGFQISIFSNK